MNVGHCLVGLDGCTIYDSVEVTRCFNCNKYGHSSRGCKNKTCCPKCAGEHNVAECKTDDLKCSNCVNYMKTLKDDEIVNLDISTDHAVWDYKSCMCFKKTMDKIKHDLFGSTI